MKKFKRILAIFLLALVITVIGYLVFTGSRLTQVTRVEETTMMEASYEQKESF